MLVLRLRPHPRRRLRLRPQSSFLSACSASRSLRRPIPRWSRPGAYLIWISSTPRRFPTLSASARQKRWRAKSGTRACTCTLCGSHSDSTVDLDGEIAGLLKQRLSFAERSEDIAETRTPAPARAAAFLAQLLFAYLYEDRTSFQDPTPESAWTVCKLTRSIVCWTDPLDLSPGLDATLRASYRRALTYPLYRSTAVCARVCEDAAELLSSAPRTRILHVLHAIDALFALAPTGTGLTEQATTVLRLVWELWIVPLQAWVSHAATDAQLEAVRAAFARHARPTPSFLVEIGTPGDWDLAALDAAAEEARLHGEGEFV